MTMPNLEVNYEITSKKRTRAVNVRLSQDELTRFNRMSDDLEVPLTHIIRSLCEAQYKALYKETENGESSSAA